MRNEFYPLQQDPNEKEKSECEMDNCSLSKNELLVKDEIFPHPISEKEKKIYHQFLEEKKKQKTNEKKNRTIFTKISEDLYNKMKLEVSGKRTFCSNRSQVKKIDNYDILTNENYLYSSGDRKNKKIIKDFLERSLSGNTKEKTNVTLISVPQTKKIKLTKCPKEFFMSQQKFDEEKRSKIEKMKNDLLIKNSHELKAKPKINSKSILLSQKNQTSKNVFDRLYNNSPSQKQKLKIIKLEKKSGRNTPKIDNETFYHLLDKRSMKTKRQKSSSPSNSSRVNTSYSLGKESNIIILDQFLDNFEKIIFEIFGKRLTETIEISKENYLKIMLKIGFITENSQNKNESKLVNELWEILLRYKIKKNENGGVQKDFVNANIVILFFLCIIGMYKKDPSTNKLPKFITNRISTTIDIKFPEKIQIKFNMFCQSYFQLTNQKKEQKHSQKLSSSLQSSRKETFTFNPRINKTRNVNRVGINLFSNSYDSEIPGKHFYITNVRESRTNIQNLENQRREKEKNNCTFRPKINKVKLSKSPQVRSNTFLRLYASRKNKKRTQKGTPDEEKLNCTFKPSCSTYNDKIFKINPLKDDEAYKSKVEQIKNKRIEQNLIKLFLDYGWLSQEREDELLFNMQKKNIIGDFSFFNERRSNKEGFEKYYKNDVKGKKLLFSFDIQIKNECKCLQIFFGDDYQKKVHDFCVENNLTQQSKAVILNSIKTEVLNRSYL